MAPQRPFTTRSFKRTRRERYQKKEPRKTKKKYPRQILMTDEMWSYRKKKKQKS